MFAAGKSVYSPGNFLVLRAKTDHGTNVVLNFGNTWKIIEFSQNCAYVSALNSCRWVNVVNDPNFLIEEVLIPDASSYIKVSGR